MWIQYIDKSTKGVRYIGFNLHKTHLAITKSFAQLLDCEYIDIEYDVENNSIKLIKNGTFYKLAKDKPTSTHINCQLGTIMPLGKYILKDRENLICTLV